MANDAANANLVLNPKLIEKYNTHPEELGGKKQLDLTKSFERFEESKKYLPGGLTGVRNPKGMIEGEYDGVHALWMGTAYKRHLLTNDINQLIVGGPSRFVLDL